MNKKKQDKELDYYGHTEALRTNLSPVGLADVESEDETQSTYEYDPHLDPSLNWAGKKERSSFTLDNRTINIHERIDPKVIIAKLRKEREQPSMGFNFYEENKLSLSQELSPYEHSEGWSNRLIAGDSALIMNSLLQKENMAGKVQCVYIDPPYGINYSSNFQPFQNKHSYDAADKNLTTEPEMIKAFRDTWELGIHSYLNYLRDRLYLSRELLNDTGSCFVQIGDENVHLIRVIMDEVFGTDNYVSLIAYKSNSGKERSKGLQRVHNYIIWYAKDKTQMKFNRLYRKLELQDLNTSSYNMKESSDGTRSKMSKEEKEDLAKLIEDGYKIFRTVPLHSTGNAKIEERGFNGKGFYPPSGSQWRHTKEIFEEIKKLKRIHETESTISSIRYYDDFPYHEYTTNWDDTGPELNKSYVVQTSPRIIRNCILMASDPGNLVFDPTCGSGTTAYVAEETGRRWITCDTSRIAIALAKQRMLTSVFDYYKLIDEREGISGGVQYDIAKKQTIGNLAKGEPPIEVSIFESPINDNSKKRVAGPFTVEGLPSHNAPLVKPLHPAGKNDEVIENDNENKIINEWVSSLLKDGIRATGNIRINFSDIELASGMRYIHAQGETTGDNPKKVMISFGPKHSTLGNIQVEMAWHEVKHQGADILLFVASQFDAEACKEIASITKVLGKKKGVELLRAQMSIDCTDADLKKGARTIDNFWLLGEPDVDVNKIEDGVDKGKVEVTVNGYDYYDPNSNQIIDKGQDHIACWMLDEDYDERCLIPDQIFITGAKKKHGWDKLSKNLKAQIDESKLVQYTGNTSLPFTPHKDKPIAVKIIDNRGVESLKVIDLDNK